MELTVYNQDFVVVGIFEVYTSLIWTDRFYEAGDFEIYTVPTTEMIQMLQPNYYLYLKSSEHMMIIEKIDTKTSEDGDSSLIVTGRSLEALLERRIVWSQTNIDDTFQNGVKQLLNDAFISPSDENRKIDNFVFQESEDEAITALTLQAQYTGDNIYEIIQSNCENFKIGFKLTYDFDNKQFVFQLYSGTDRSYSQTKNPYIIFSEKFQKLYSGEFVQNITDYKSVALVGGEGEGSDRKFKEVVMTEGTDDTGINRRELFTDARDVSTTTDDDVTLTDAEYYEQLRQRGIEDLTDYKVEQTFDGKINRDGQYTYGEDYTMGDTVQIEDDLGHSCSSQITEMIFCMDSNGYAEYPTFTSNDYESEDEES